MAKASASDCAKGCAARARLSNMLALISTCLLSCLLPASSTSRAVPKVNAGWLRCSLSLLVCAVL